MSKALWKSTKYESCEFIIVHFEENFVSESDSAVSVELPEWKADSNCCSLEDILIATLLHVFKNFR